MKKTLLFCFVIFFLGCDKQVSCSNEIADILNEIKSIHSSSASPDEKINYFSDSTEIYGDADEVFEMLTSTTLTSDNKKIIVERFGDVYFNLAINLKKYAQIDFYLKSGVSPFVANKFLDPALAEVALNKDLKTLEIIKTYYSASRYPILERIEKYINVCD